MYTIYFTDGTVTTRDSDCSIEEELQLLRDQGFNILRVV